jgi:hypothetical protein
MQFERAAQERSAWPRAMAFAALVAAELLAFDPDHAARALLTDDAASIPAPNDDSTWPGPNHDRRTRTPFSRKQSGAVVNGTLLEVTSTNWCRSCSPPTTKSGVT